MRPSRLVAVLIACAVVVGIVGTVGLSAPKPANAQPPAVSSGPAGRYVIVVNPGNPQVTVLLDTQSGRSWLICDTKGDSALTATTLVNHNWCAMRVFGTASRP